MANDIKINHVHRELTGLSAMCCPVCFQKGRWTYDDAALMYCINCRAKNRWEVAWRPWDIMYYRREEPKFLPGCPYDMAMNIAGQSTIEGKINWPE